MISSRRVLAIFCDVCWCCLTNAAFIRGKSCDWCWVV